MALLVSCNANIRYNYHVDHLNSYTPLEGKGNIDWINAMLSTIETEHIMRGDSVNLSPFFVIRNYLEEGFIRYYQSNGKTGLSLQGSPMELIDLLERRGIMPYDSYSHHRDADILSIYNKVKKIADTALENHSPKKIENQVHTLLDESLGYAPLHVFMLGAEYTPQEFARSVCAPNEYVSLSINEVPSDSLLAMAIKAVNNNHGVCWQCNNGDCKAIVGIAHDDVGNRYLIMKTSSELEYISYEEFKARTQAIVLPFNIER